MADRPRLSGNRVLITGGAGFIGSQLANSLADRNDVIALDDCSLGDPSHLDAGVTLLEQSVLDDEWPDDIDVLVHLAAVSSRELVTAEPGRATRVNVEGFVNAVEQARAAGCDTIVYASTASLYDDDPPGIEHERAHAGTRYEATMLAREAYAEALASQNPDLSIAGLRFFSVYQGLDAGESHKGVYANTVSQWAEQLAAGERPVLWGDGTQTRDYVHVRDVVRAIEAVAVCECSGIYNVGTGENWTFEETVALLNEALGTSIEPTYRPVPLENYNYRQRADPTKLQAETGWKPKTDFPAGVRRLCEGH